MGLMTRLGRRGAAVSFLEIAAFFLVLTPVFFFVTASFYVVPASLAKVIDWPPPFSWGWLGACPIWMYVLQALAYILLITLYWVPGDEAANETELRGFALFLAALVVAAGATVGAVWLEGRYHPISKLLSWFR